MPKKYHRETPSTGENKTAIEPPMAVLPQSKHATLFFAEASPFLTILAGLCVSLVVFPFLFLLVLHALTLFPGISHAFGTIINYEATKGTSLLEVLISPYTAIVSGFVLIEIALAKYIKRPPTHLYILPEGLIAFSIKGAEVPLSEQKRIRSMLSGKPWTLLSLNGAYAYSGKVLAKIKWSELTSLTMDHKNTTGGALVCFQTRKKNIKLQLADVLTQEVRVRFLEAIKTWAPTAHVDSEVYDLLEPRPETSFTELWISALSASPNRHTVSALTMNTKLNEGRYEVLNQLSSGGQAVVYLARDLHTTSQGNQEVVVKEFIFPIFVGREATKSAIASLEHEANLLKHLDHSGIVKILDFFIADHRGYLVFEHIDGPNLRQLIENEGALPETSVRKILQELLKILKFLHSQKPPIVHSDFTPDNLILSTGGNIKLIDFNVSKTTTETVNALVLGKRAYMPPEQFRGKSTTQSDIYALGGCLHFLLTGVEPEPLSVSSPKNIAPELSDEINNVVIKCTQLESTERYQSVQEIWDALGELKVED